MLEWSQEAGKSAVTIEIVLLALASTFRPASLVAVYALVREPSPSRLFTAYVIAGLAFTLAVGTAALLLLGGTEVHAGTSSAKAGAEIGAGVVTLCVGAAVALRRVPVGSGGGAGAGPAASAESAAAYSPNRRRWPA